MPRAAASGATGAASGPAGGAARIAFVAAALALLHAPSLATAARQTSADAALAESSISRNKSRGDIIVARQSQGRRGHSALPRPVRRDSSVRPLGAPLQGLRDQRKRPATDRRQRSVPPVKPIKANKTVERVSRQGGPRQDKVKQPDPKAFQLLEEKSSNATRGRRTKALLVGFQYSPELGGQLMGTCYDLGNMVRFAKLHGYQDIRYFTDRCFVPDEVRRQKDQRPQTHIGFSRAAHLRDRKTFPQSARANIIEEDEWPMPQASHFVQTTKAFVGPAGKSMKARLRAAFSWLVQDAAPGDGLLFHYSGHGMPVRYTFAEAKLEKEEAKDECTGTDEALLLPVLVKGAFFNDAKFRAQAFYSSNELFRDLVVKVPRGAHLFAMVDTCYSGTILDLPWNWMSQKYYYTCPEFPEKRQSRRDQFTWEWAKSPEELGREYPLNGTVTLITGSQSSQVSRDAGMTRVATTRGTKENFGGVLTGRLIIGEKDKAPLLLTAMAEGWSWAKFMSKLVREVAGGSEWKLKSGGKQIPNFCASHRLDMSAPITLDASAFQGRRERVKEKEMKCDSGRWLKSKAKMKAPSCQ
mmetsp:Transcript_103160/g.315618  ORF Transcript_103160/g.315618 Transcript_103160/m.315618 type:complete len:582 (-) Transcript_103160:87-1832(-)